MKVAKVVDIPHNSLIIGITNLSYIENSQDLLGFEPGPSCLTKEATANHPKQPQSDNLPLPPPSLKNKRPPIT